MNIFLKSTLILSPIFCFGQVSTIEKEVTKNACECVNKINENELMSRKHFYVEINKCIDEQVLIFQLSDKLGSGKIAEKKSNKEDTVNIKIDTNKNSADYLNYYRTIEDNLLEECKDFKNRIAASEIGMENEIPSKNEKALDFYNKGNNEVRNNNWEKAAEYYKKATNEDPDFTFAWDNLGVNMRRLNRYEDAIAAYEKSLSIDPYGKMPLQNIAVVYIYSGKYEKAKESYEKFAKVYPDYVEPIYGLANLYIAHLKDYEKGLDYACKAFISYIESNSPYRSDAEQLIKIAYQELKKQGKEHRFDEILKENNINNQ